QGFRIVEGQVGCALVQVGSGMAKAPKTSLGESDSDDVAKALEQALDRNLIEGSDDLDIAASMEDLEAQITKAAEELSRESRAPAAVEQSRAATKAAPEAASPAPTPAAPARPAPATPAFSPANDDRLRDTKTVLERLNARPSGAIYWAVGILSL